MPLKRSGPLLGPSVIFRLYRTEGRLTTPPFAGLGTLCVAPCLPPQARKNKLDIKATCTLTLDPLEFVI